MEDQIELAGGTYKIGTLDAFKQFHVARRLAPALFALSEAAASVGEAGNSFLNDSESSDAQDDAPKSNSGTVAVLVAFRPVAEAIARMSDDDANYVLKTCLSVVFRQQGTGWQRIMVKDNLLFQDITMQTMMQLAARVIQGNMGNFFCALQASSQPGRN